MKTKYLLLGAIFAVFGLTARAQVTEMYYQGFESGETVTYSGSPTGNVRYSNAIHSGGSRALKLVQHNSQEVEFILDTLDFTQNTTLRYIALRFDHICRVPKNSSDDLDMAKIYYKRANQTTWTACGGSEYNVSGGPGSYSSNFPAQGAFLENSYDDWWSQNVATVANSQWRSERFDLDNVITSQVPANERKLIIKFVLRHRTQTTTLDTINKAWWIDNIKVSASADRMVNPKITMYEYPNVEFYPNSRGAHIELAATTNLSAGINPDSVYLYYKVGSDTSRTKISLTPVAGVSNRYECRIPFFGYDTLMQFYCVACDATSNANRVTFPPTDDSWVSYRCVRGMTEQHALETPGFVPNGSTWFFPFPNDADHRSEYVYDSVLMHNAGYGPGAITSLTFTLAGSGVTEPRTHPRFQVKMKNVSNSHALQMDDEGKYHFTKDAMHIVYDSVLSMPVMPANLPFTINLQDTFYYAGGAVLVQITYDGTADFSSNVAVKTISVPEAKATMFVEDGDAEYGFNAFTSDNFEETYSTMNTRPAILFYETHLQPLVYDMGFDTNQGSPDYGLVTPNFDVPMIPTDHSIQVKLKNQGAATVNAIQIRYSIDDGAVTGSYNWNNASGLAAGQVQLVTIAPNVSLTPGFHTLKVWVEDTLTAGGQQYRDHEPYNDTIYSPFVVCDGPMSGVKNIGGTSPDFSDIESFLFSLSRCGIDDSLIVRLAPGEHPAFTMPVVPGISEQNYIVFESRTSTPSVIYADTTTLSASIVNVAMASNIRFRNLHFVRHNGELTDMVTLGENSVNCRFEGCSFIDELDNPVASLRINSMIFSGNADNLVVDSCSFVGGNIGVNAKGPAPDDYSSGVVVRKSSFSNQYTNAVKVEYMDSVTVVDNEMMNVYSNSSYVLLLTGCSGAVDVQRNRIYTSHGAGAMAVNDVVGTASRRAIVANNMMVSNDDGTANQLTSPFNIIQGDWIDVVYNAVKMVAPTRINVAATTFGGGSLNNSRFLNNIVASLDNSNYAFSYQPLTSTTNTVGHNDYFSMSPILNRRGTSSLTSLVAWQSVVTDDTASVSVNPNYLNTTLVDLRTYNRNIKGVGVPIATVPYDFFGMLRGDTVTCPGVFEFSSQPYDFEVEALVSPEADVCYMPASVQLVVRMRNNGISVYDSTNVNPLQLYCKVGNGAVHTLTVTDSIPADDTVSIHTGYMLSLPSATYDDATYSIRVWIHQADDPNQTNDTNVFSVISRYHPAAPADILDSIPYSSIDTITPVTGVDTWKVYGATSAPRRPSQLYWYNDSTDTEPFFVGPTYITDVMQQDAEYYIRQRRSMPIVRITQVEIMHTAAAAGVTSPMPLWMDNARKVAVQLTNIGDATAYLEGDTLMTVSPTATLNNKVYTFGNVKIEPGHSLVVQYSSSAATDSNVTIRNGINNISVAYNSNLAFVYKRGGVVEDAIPLNAVITTSSTQAVTWANLNVPSYVWNGPALTIGANNKAGIFRTEFNGDVGDWEISSNDMPMFLANTDPDWVMYEDNGCEGELGHVTVAIMAPPSADIDVTAPVFPETACGMSYEDVTVTVSNFGYDTVSNVVLNYCAGADTVTDTIVGQIMPRSDTVYTFGTQLNLAFTSDSLVTVRVWADSVTGDPILSNDTSVATVFSLYTPTAPAAIADRVVAYATRDTITDTSVAGVIPVWYDYDLNPVDTGYTNVTELLYGNGTRGVAHMVFSEYSGQVGSAVTTNAKTAFPSPYQSSSKFVKQQYLYSGADLRTSGLEESVLKSIAFYFDTMDGTATTSVNFLNYTIAMGMTSDTIFANSSDWKDVSTVVFQRDTFTLTQSDDHAWVTHQLSTPYQWDGVSTVVVQISYELASAVTTGMRTRYTSKANTTLCKNQNGALLPSTFEYSGAGSTPGGNRPNIMFNSVTYGCIGPMTTYNITLSGMPQYDAAIFWPEGSGTVEYNSCDTIALPLKMRNQGGLDIDTLVLYYTVDTLALDSTIVIDTFEAGHLYDLTLFRRVLSPGRHTVTAIVSVPGDSISSNDTISCSFAVRFCAGNYTIAVDDPTADYHSFGAAIDTLNQVGVVGPVTFVVSPGTYTEQVVLNNVVGSSDVNTISFVGQTDSVLLTASTSQAVNYVMMIDGASNVTIDNIMIEARPIANNVNYANALVLQNDSNIHINNCYLKVKGTIFNANASCMVLQGNVADLTVTGTVTDSGYYAIKTAGTENNYSNFHINNNTFRNFASGGLNIRGINRINISQNTIQSGNSADNRGLIGLYLAETTDSMVVQKNFIYLVDERKGAKRGIQLEQVTGTALAPAFIVNNMISTHGTNSQGLTPAKSAGIWIDSNSTYVNVIYNSVRVRGYNLANPNQMNAANNLSYAFWCGTSPTMISVTNNILSNFGYGYAYYVSQASSVTTSNNNAYFTEGTNAFAWGTTTNITSLSDLQTINSNDGSSVFEEPFFMSNSDLHLTMTNFAAKAQNNPDVIDDIDGTPRPILGPTIGAHEKERLTHDMAVVRIYKPFLPASLAAATNVETDSVLVVASFNNNGLSNETGVQWYAYIDGHESDTRSVTRNLGSFTPSQIKKDSVMIPTVLGIIDTQIIRVVVTANNDINLDDNELTNPFYLAPAFNLSAELMEVQQSGCRRYETPIKIKVKNSGSKAFPAGTSFEIGYHTELTYPTSGVTVTTLPDTVRETVTLANILPVGSDQVYTFATTANLYPTNNDVDIKVRVRGWVHYLYDITTANDTTALNNSKSPNVDSYYTPAPPLGHDTTFAYGTWGEVTAEQENNRPIRWYRDSTAAPFYSPSNYNSSKKWSNTPQYFHDSTYYLCCVSTKSCTSYFSPVNVSVTPRKTRDIAVESMVAPLGDRVYMENDTVRVQIANYGTTAQSNFPITYQLKRGNNVLQTVTENVTTNLAQDQTYIFTFDSLLQIPTPTMAQNYTLSVWTDLTNDATRRNDTLRTAHAFKSLAQSVYSPTEEDGLPTAENTAFDITRVSFNEIDLQIPELNRSYTNMVVDYTQPDYPLLHVTRGTTDSIIVGITPLDATGQRFRCRGTVAIDYNRDGVFANAGGCNEVILNAEPFWSDSLLTSVITIPQCASLGYMRMRVKVKGYASESTDGHIIDFLLFVDEEAPANDLAITQIVSPRSYIIRDNSPKVVSFRMANKGRNPITAADINYSFVGDTVDSTATNVIHWTGDLQPGQSTVVDIPAHVFPLGTSTLTIWHDMMDDADSTNNSYVYEYHFFHTVKLVMRENFDDRDYWYAPVGYNKYSKNYWQRGMPNKGQPFDTTYSGEYAWVTDLNNNIVTGKRGSVSYLYSPIINTQQIHPDTIAFRMVRNMTGGSFLRLEYYNFAGKWVNLECDTVSTWHNDVENAQFNGVSPTSAGYVRYSIPTVSTEISGEFPELIQFRFVYITPMGGSTTSSYGKGCAIDDVYIGRAPRAVDAGLIAITQPVAPKFGQTIYPEVVLKNYGTDTLRNITIGYTHYGGYLPKFTTIACHVPPQGIDTFMLTTPFIVTSDYPDTFYISAFTYRSDDVYTDNDSIEKAFALSPLENDISAEGFLAPLDNVVAGDTSIRITMRLRNFGVNGITHATASYILNGVSRVDEEIDFEALLGRPLQSMEYYNYTFHRKITAPMGVMTLTAFIKSPNNDYIYNDTIYKRCEGIMSVTDVAAASVIVMPDHHIWKVTLVIDNVGARGVNNFEVGYWIDNDTSTMVRETYYRAEPLPALSTGYHYFINNPLPDRSSGYNIVNAFVHIPGDNDPSNDTTDVMSTSFVDVEVLKVIVEENANENCRVFLQVRNNGNVTVTGQEIRMRAAINGSDSITTTLEPRLDPGETRHLAMTRRIPKSPIRQYVGTGWIRPVSGDNNLENDQTSIVEVINYMEGVPTVNGDKLVLEQNYPNPFSQQTTIPFTIPNAAKVRFFVMDAMGHIVHRAEQYYQAGSHMITIDMDAYAAGIYYYGIEVDGQRQMRKMILR